MRNLCKRWFIPHKDNDYHPHLLHTHRAIHFSSVFVMLKVFLFVLALSIPVEAYLTSDNLVEQETRIMELINTTRENNGLNTLKQNEKLVKSATLKSVDMANRQYFAHESEEKKKLADWLEDVDYTYVTAGENLAMGVATAEEMVNAWVESSTHNANIMNGSFVEQGIHIVGGINNGWPVLYVAHHFGQPYIRNNITNSSEYDNISNLIINKESSFVDWRELDQGTILVASIKVSGDVSAVRVLAGSETITLTKSSLDLWSGSVYIDQPPKLFFNVITPPRVELLDTAGNIHTDTLSWKKLFVPEGSALNTYKLAKVVGPITHIFQYSTYFYLFFVIFFSIALLINILVEVRRQHFHIIGQTLSIIVLLVSLLFV